MNETKDNDAPELEAPGLTADQERRLAGAFERNAPSHPVVPAQLPPLLEKCSVCDGDGMIYSEKWRAFNEKYPGYEEWQAAVDRKEEPRELEERDCRQCNGSGKVPTEAGKKILELVRIAS